MVGSSRIADELLLGGCLAVYGTYVYLGLKTPLPGQDQDVSAGLEVEKHEFTTEDGLTLRLKRYVEKGGTPVLLCHGFGSSGMGYDIAREGRNVSAYLARNGFDVWISSFRGCGREPYDSEGGDWWHSVDHLGIYDVPALVNGISRVTGKKPFCMGHSMGGIALYIYLQGARFDEKGRVVSDPELVEEHNGRLLGAMTICSPSRVLLRHPVHAAYKSALGRASLVTYIRIMRALEIVSHRVRAAGTIERLFGRHPRAMKAFSRMPVHSLLLCRRNTDSETTTWCCKWTYSDYSTGMTIQFMEAILNNELRELVPGGNRRSPYSYSQNMEQISVPIFFLAGSEDFADTEGVRSGYDTVSSGLKKFEVMPGYGHTDMLMGKNVEKDVYPLIVEWIREVEALNA